MSDPLLVVRLRRHAAKQAHMFGESVGSEVALIEEAIGRIVELENDLARCANAEALVTTEGKGS